MIQHDSAIDDFFAASEQLFAQIQSKSAALTLAALSSRRATGEPTAASLDDNEAPIDKPDTLSTAFSIDTLDTTRDCFTALLELESKIEWMNSGKASGAAYTQLLGPGCLYPNISTRFGLFWLPPNCHYASHIHAADEIYIPIAGHIEFSLDDEDFVTGPLGDGKIIDSMVAHALKTQTHPALLLWSWNGEISMSSYRYT
ncbi:MAG: dimethylsulfonioproprionate lyase family protein [Pseudomonadota bacterium]